MCTISKTAAIKVASLIPKSLKTTHFIHPSANFLLQEFLGHSALDFDSTGKPILQSIERMKSSEVVARFFFSLGIIG